MKDRARGLKKKIHADLLDENLRIIGSAPLQKRGRGIASIVKVAALILLSISSLLFIANDLNPEIDGVNLSTPQLAPNHNDRGGRAYSPAEFANMADMIDRTKMPVRKALGFGIKTIVLDAGHGGDDPGAIGRLGTKEKDITLDIAQRLKERLTRKDYNVLMTRKGDESLTLSQRVEFANANKADLFISLHVNYLPLTEIDIVETYYFGPSTDPKVLRLAAYENRGSDYGMGDYEDVIKRIGATMKFQESKAIAASIQKSLFSNIRKKKEDIQDFGVKRAPFVVLLGANAPGALVEIACLSNSQEEKRLNDAAYRDNIAKYIEDGIINYLKTGR
ncbi:MAG: N-acetylmuramoyl-L-alanine amidase [Nitrospirae bacterium]|nr:N-acetylmuramoyl-L-alanine amidase [Nitrospirota bacterium]